LRVASIHSVRQGLAPSQALSAVARALAQQSRRRPTQKPVTPTSSTTSRGTSRASLGTPTRSSSATLLRQRVIGCAACR
jgi:hypothetical protein